MVLWSHDFAGKAGDIPQIPHFKLFPIPMFYGKMWSLQPWPDHLLRPTTFIRYIDMARPPSWDEFPKPAMISWWSWKDYQGTCSAIPTLGEFRIRPLNLSLHPQSVLLKYKLLRHLHHCFYALIQYPSSVGYTSTAGNIPFGCVPQASISIHILGSGTKDFVVNMLAREIKNSFFDRWYALFCWDLHTSSFAIARILALDISPWFEHLISTPHRMLSNCWFGASSLYYDKSKLIKIAQIYWENSIEMILK